METPTKVQAERLMGEVCKWLLEEAKVSHFDYTQFGVVDDPKQGIHWPYTLNKLTNRVATLPNEVVEKIGAINLYMVDSESTYLEKSIAFTVSLMLGKPKMTGPELEAYRKSVGMTQAEFASSVGLQRKATISDYENEVKQIPDWLVKMIELQKQVAR